MLKPLTFSLSLALALGASSLAFAGGHLSKAMPSGQCEGPSPQSVVASPQSECGGGCGPVQAKHKLCDLFKHRQKCYTYEWVLKKKRVCNFGGLFHHKNNGCSEPACDSCGVTPSAQWASPQGEWSSPQAGYPAAQSYSAGQIAPAGPVEAAPAPAPAAAPGTVPPPPAAAAPSASNSVLFLTPAGN